MTDDELLALAQEAEQHDGFVRRRRKMTDFRYDERQERYWDVTTGTLLAPKSVDGAIPKEWWPTKPVNKAGDLKPYAPSIAINDVDTGLTVEGSTWWPGMPRFINDVVIDDRGLMRQKGAVCYNTYYEPDRSQLRTDACPQRWIDHIKKLWPDPAEHEHFFDFAAHMIQKPHEKVNHGIVIAGVQGIGKDTAMMPLRKGVGEHNTAEVEPDAISKAYNPYVKSVMLVINEVRPHDEDHKASSFYNQLKPLLAAPPEMLPMEVKYANVVYVRNLCHVFLTTNEPLTMYIPVEDRRLFVMTSRLPDPRTNKVFEPDYFPSIHAYLEDGGIDAAITWLMNRDITSFNAGAPPASTWGKVAIISSADQIRRSISDEVIEQYIHENFAGKHPDVIFPKDFLEWIPSGKWFDDASAAIKAVQSKGFHFKMEEHGYDMVRNPHAQEWKCGKYRSRAAFVRKTVPMSEQLFVISTALEKRPLVF